MTASLNETIDRIVHQVILEHTKPKRRKSKKELLNRCLRSLFCGPEDNGWDANYYFEKLKYTQFTNEQWIGLYKSFAKYAKKKLLANKAPTMYGFDKWREKIDDKCLKLGMQQSLFPNYYRYHHLL